MVKVLYIVLGTYDKIAYSNTNQNLQLTNRISVKINKQKQKLKSALT